MMTTLPQQGRPWPDLETEMREMRGSDLDWGGGRDEPTTGESLEALQSSIARVAAGDGAAPGGAARYS